jgi:L(+)-tartrate dehydratase alpha subunit
MSEWVLHCEVKQRHIRRSQPTRDAALKVGNSIGMGAMGFMGSSMVIDCHIEVGYCHTGGLPMSVHMFCLSSRRACARIFADGRVQFRTDPMWFTDYMRRETVEWERSAAEAAE